MRWSVIVLCVLIVIAGRFWHHWTPASDYPPATFTLPITTLACIPYYPKDGETLAAWDFQQPIRMDFRGLTGTVRLQAYGTTTFHFGEGCRFGDLGGGRMSDATLIIQ